MKYLLFIFLIVCFQACGSCDLNPESCSRNFSFEIPLNISPDRDTINIGDTLWLSSSIPAELDDLITGEKVFVLNHDFMLESTMNRMDVLGAPDAENDFETINEIGEQIIMTAGPYFTSKYKYEILGDFQKIKIGLVPIKVGLYEIAFYYLTKNLEDVKLTESKCRENIMLRNNMNNGSDNNYYLLLDSPNPINTPEGYKMDGGYAFVVIE